jgi:imidazolonepropionase-like amidohydrolase
MMTWTKIALAAALAAAPARAGGELLAIRVGRAETVSGGPVENAVILIEGKTIALVGEDLVVERGIPVLDRPQWTAMPGLVNAYSRLGLSGNGGAEATPALTPVREIYPHDPVYDELAETGVTTLVLYPPGTGIPGQAVVVRPGAETRDEMLVDQSAYLKIYFRSSSRSKKLIRDGFEKVDAYEEKEKKAREKYEKDKEKAEKAKKKPSKKDEVEKKEEEQKEEEQPDEGGKAAEEEKKKKKEEEKKEEELGPYVPPEPEPDVVPFMQLRSGELNALVAISDAGDYLHLLDAIGEEEFQWDLRVPMTRELDLYEIAERLGEKKVRVLLEPEISLHPGTMRQRNSPAELTRAGAKLVLVPREDTIQDFKRWLPDTGLLIGAGLARDVALRALTLEPAEMIGLGARLGSIEKGKDANLIFFEGDPFELSSRLEAVMFEGEFIYGGATE